MTVQKPSLKQNPDINLSSELMHDAGKEKRNLHYFEEIKKIHGINQHCTPSHDEETYIHISLFSPGQLLTFSTIGFIVS